MKFKLAFITYVVIITSACSTLKKTTSTVDDQVNNVAWGIISFKGKMLNSGNFPNGMPTIQFNMQDGKINGNDGCNNFMGIATYTATTIKPGAIASTKMACNNGSFESDFFEVLAAPIITYHLTNGVLRLFVNDAEVMALKAKS